MKAPSVPPRLWSKRLRPGRGAMPIALLALSPLLAAAGGQDSASTSPVQSAAPVLRPEDQRVAEIAFRLATAARARCPVLSPSFGLALQHLGQFTLADRPAAVAQYALDKGPGVLAVMPGGPAASAGVSAGDILLAINGTAVPPPTGLQNKFDQTASRARTDALLDLLDQAAAHSPVTLSLLRGQARLDRSVTPVFACPSRVYLARSRQLNAFADGRHVFLTTKLLDYTKTDDELAFVIGHEMAHNILGHAAVVRAAKAGAGVASLRTSAVVRRTEREADLLSTDLLLDAGFRTEGAASVLRALDSGVPEPAFLSLHDSTGARAAMIAAHAAVRNGRRVP